MDNLEQRLESLRDGVGNMQHGLPGDEDCYTAAEVIDAALAELRRLSEVIDEVLAEVERHRMTDEERRAVAFTLSALAWPLSADQLVAKAKSLGPSFVAPEHPKRVLIGNYLDRTKEVE